jgi:hypothetical protein
MQPLGNRKAANMDLNPIVQGILTNWFSDLLILVGGAALAVLRKKNSPWAGVAAYFLIGCACMSVIVFTFVGHAILAKETPQTTAENIEPNIRAWSDQFSLGIQKQADDNFDFAYAISLHSGRTVLVGRPKVRDRYLQFQGNVTLAPEHEAAVQKLSLSQQQRLADEINLEMARNKIGFAFIGPPFKGIRVSKGVPITSNLTEDSFAASLDEIDSSILLARESLRLAFFRVGIPDVVPSTSLLPSTSK